MGANFVLQKPITPNSAIRCFNAALSFMVRERRRYFRCPIDLSVVLCFGQGQEVKARATNLSEGGMAIYFEGVLPKGSISKVEFTLPGSKISMEPKGEIAWADGLGRAGIRFLEVPDSSREQLEKWLMRRLEAETRPSPQS